MSERKRPRLVLGVVLLAFGLAAIAVGGLLLPAPVVPFQAGVLVPPGGTTLPATTDVPSNTTLPFPGAATGDRLGGNYTVERNGMGATPPVSFYLMDRQDWATYNSSFDAGHRFPTSFVLAVANRSSSTWSVVDDNGTPYVLLYLATDGGFANLSESAYLVSPTGVESPAAVPPNVSIAPQGIPLDRSVLPSGPLNASSWGLGGAVRLSESSGTGAVLYVLSPNGTASCPTSSFLPDLPACAGRTADQVALPASGESVSWFVRVHGEAGNWSLLVLAGLYRAGFLSYNATVWTFPSSVVFNGRTILEAVGATLGFFGFLATTGALVRGRTVSPSASAGPGLGGSEELQALGAGTPPLGPETPIATEALEALAPGRSVHVTCGMCGTGYQKTRDLARCPICGSGSVVLGPPTGVDFL